MFISMQQLTGFLVIEVLQLFGSAMKWPLFSYSQFPCEKEVNGLFNNKQWHSQEWAAAGAPPKPR